VKIKISEIPIDGMDIAFDMSDDWALEAAFVSVEGKVTSLTGDLEVKFAYENLKISGNIDVEVDRECDRCGEKVNLAIKGGVELTYRLVEPVGEGVRELSGSELDVGFYTGDNFEIGDAVSEHLALLLPMRVACDVSEATPYGKACDIEFIKKPKKEADPRFAILQTIKFEN
jgi:uncharacterized metal-binding protein YceD (DUF177 family)